MVSWSLSRYFSWGKTISCSGEFSLMEVPRLFSSEIILKSFCSERTLMRHTLRYSKFLNLESSSTPQNILQCTAIWECILVLKLHRRSLFWFLTVSNNHCSETLGICCVIFPVWWAMNGSKPFCTWNKLNSTVSFTKHRMGALSSNHTRIYFFKHSK